MIEWFVLGAVRRRKAVLLAWLLFAVASALAAVGLELDALPDITSNQIQVLTRAPGLAPEEVELRVTRPLEVALGGMPGLASHRSTSRYGLSAITAVFHDGVDPYRARQLVAERVSGAGGDLPEGVERPELGPMTGGLGEILHFTVSSPSRSPAELHELVERVLVPPLRSVPGVVEVNSWGGEERSLTIEAHPHRMAARGVSLADLQSALLRSLGATAGAALPAGPSQSLLRAVARPKSPTDLAALSLSVDPSRGRTNVGDVADVRFGALPRLGTATANGAGETVYVMVQMLSGANALAVTDQAREALGRARVALPPDVKLRLVYDRSHLVHATLRTVGKSLAEGGALVCAVLFVLLGSWRAGLLVALAIPIAMAGATAAMRLLGIPGNLMSLGAVDFGVVVDGAVVIVENVFHALTHGAAAVSAAHGARAGQGHAPPGEAAEASAEAHTEAPPASLAPSPKLPFAERVGEAAALVARPTFFGAGILTLVYVPVLSLTGVDGKMFRPMAITVVLALTIALVFALSFVPAAAASWLRERDVPSRDPWLVRALTALYVPVLVLVRRHPLAVGVASLTILGGGLYGMAHLGSELAPTLDEGSLVIQTTRAPDISLESSALDAQRLERALLERFPREVVQVVSRVGSPAVATDVMGFEQADVFVELAPRERWRPGLDKTALVAEMEAHLAEADPTANPGFTQPIQMRFNELLGGAPTDVVVGVFGHDLDELRHVAEEVHAAILPVRGVQDARILAPDALPVLEVVPRPVDVERAGLSVRDVLDTVQAMRFGLVVGMSYLGPHPMPVVLGLGGEGRTAFDLRSLPVPLSSGVTVPLSALADVRSIEGPGAIGHDGGERRLFVGFNVRGRDLGDTVGDARAAIGKAMSLPTGMRLEWGGQVETLRAALERLAVVVPAVLALILALLAVAFRSLRVALVVFGLVPFASVGGVAALALRGMTLSVTAHIGFIALSGIAVMNGVVLVNEIRRRQALGADVHEASFEAARSRMRPVVMTALVAALGFLPMMVATGVGAEVQRPLATVVFGGLLSSTLLTLFVLPTVYPYLVGWRRPEGRRGGGSPSAEPEPAAS